MCPLYRVAYSYMWLVLKLAPIVQILNLCSETTTQDMIQRTKGALAQSLSGEIPRRQKPQFRHNMQTIEGKYDVRILHEQRRTTSGNDIEGIFSR